jgi:hypothetical protein
MRDVSPTPTFVFAALALLLLVLTLAWRIPMMLWDHLDLVPIYDAWRAGTLGYSGFLSIHGGHLHTAAYVLLLATTQLSGGETWLDCLASWALLVAFAAVVAWMSRSWWPDASRISRVLALLVVLLALHPGHLANLQWGWQVAVFLCLASVAVTILCLTRETLAPWQVGVAVIATVVALLSFATSIALLPTALVLLALRRELPAWRRLAYGLPWLVAGVLLALEYRRPEGTGIAGHAGTVVAYAFNFLGAGLARFATDLAPWLALGGLVTGAWAFAVARRRQEALAWLGFLLFGGFAALAVAAGRAAPFGSEHAFVTRYVSFSLLFWIGWAGLVATAWLDATAMPRAIRASVWLVVLLSVANALHMARKAERLSERTQAIADTVRATWPAVDAALLGEISFDQPAIARERLERLHALGFAPFGAVDD